MAFRFQKRIKIAPGVRINLSKSGISGSLGPNGATVNVSKRGVTGTAGIPGTGLSHQTRLMAPQRGDETTGKSSKIALWIVFLALVGGAALLIF